MSNSFVCALSGSTQIGKPHHHLIFGDQTLPISNAAFMHLRNHVSRANENQNQTDISQSDPVQSGVVIITSVDPGTPDLHFTKTAVYLVSHWRKCLDLLFGGGTVHVPIPSEKKRSVTLRRVHEDELQTV